MVEKPLASEQVSHIIGLYHRGILGPSAMWLGIAEQLQSAMDADTLNSLSDDVQEQLLSAYIEWPPQAYIAETPLKSEDAKFQSLCAQIVNWCEIRRPLDRPTQPDGLVRVSVDAGIVKEWRSEIDSQKNTTSEDIALINSHRTSAEQIHKLIRAYIRGICHPTEMWYLLAEKLISESVNDVLDLLPEESKIRLQQVCSTCPPKESGSMALGVWEMRSLDKEHCLAVWGQIEKWCEVNQSTRLPQE